jgi:hypothetical protein
VSSGRARQRSNRAPARIGDASDSTSTAGFLVLVCFVTVMVRLAYVWMPLRSDEAGYLLAARHWAPETGRFVYGDYHVDRPPLLMGIYRFAALWESDAAVRVLTIPFVVVGVLALARAGMLLAGRTGARCAAAVGAALLCSPVLAGDQADGELFAAVFVAGSVAATLQAWNAQRPSVLAQFAVLAGALAASATLVKQNFADGFLFACVLLLAHGLRQRQIPRALAVAAGGAIGAAAVIAVVAGWALTAEIDLARTWFDLVEFRGDALRVLSQGSLEAPAARAARLLLFAVISMVAPIAWVWVRWLQSRQWQVDPEHWALTVLLGYALWSMALGGSFWPHYLLQMAPPVALAAGMVAASSGPAGMLMRRLARTAVTSALGCWAVMIAVYALVPLVWFPQHIGHWVRASSGPNDTVFVAYGYPSVLESADLPSPYPYLWSLPMRTLDPELRQLRQTLSGPDAPTWVVRINSLNSWEIDSSGRLGRLIDARYEHVSDVCGHDIYLRVGVERELAPVPVCWGPRP